MDPTGGHDRPRPRRGTRTNRAPTSDQGWHRPEPSAPIDQQVVAVDAQHAALDPAGAGGRQAVAVADVAAVHSRRRDTSLSLSNFSLLLAETGRGEEAAEAMAKSVGYCRRSPTPTPPTSCPGSWRWPERLAVRAAGRGGPVAATRDAARAAVALGGQRTQARWLGLRWPRHSACVGGISVRRRPAASLTTRRPMLTRSWRHSVTAWPRRQVSGSIPAWNRA